MRRATLAVAVAVVVLGAGIGLVPPLLEQRDIPAQIPSPAALQSTALVAVPGGGRACWRYAVAERHARRARLRVATGGRAGEPRELTMPGAGSRSASRLAGGYAAGTTVTIPVARPPGDRVVLTCVRNLGRRPVRLYASRDRTRSRS